MLFANGFRFPISCCNANDGDAMDCLIPKQREQIGQLFEYFFSQVRSWSQQLIILTAVTAQQA